MLTQVSRLDVMHRLGRAMADPTRSRILLRLLDDARYPGDLAHELELTRSNVSNHLSCLRDCGIVVAHPEGRQMRYEIADPHLKAALTALMDVTLAVNSAAPCIEPGCHICNPAPEQSLTVVAAPNNGPAPIEGAAVEQSA